MADLDSILDASLAGADTPAPAADPPAPAAADPTPAPTPAAPPAPAPAPPADPDPFDTGADTFDRGYVEKLRNEAAERRVRAKELEDRYGSAFDGVGDDEAAVWLDVVKTWKQDPTAVAEWMREQAEAILSGQEQPAPPAGQQPGDQPLTRAEVEQLLAQRDQASKQQEMVAAVNKEVADLGVDPNGRAGKELMLRALEDHGGDIGAAHKAMQTEQAALKQAAIDEYLAKKAEGAGGPAPVTATGGAAPAPAKISNIKDAAKGLDAYLASQGMK